MHVNHGRRFFKESYFVIIPCNYLNNMGSGGDMQKVNPPQNAG